MQLTPMARPLQLSGNGFPEGVISAPPGSTFTDVQLTTGASRWVKTSGNGSTGWQILDGDTGWRDVTDVLSNPAVMSSGENQFDKWLLRRMGSIVFLSIPNVIFHHNSFLEMSRPWPIGFSPPGSAHFYPAFHRDTGEHIGVINAHGGGLYGGALAGVTTPTNVCRAELSWATEERWPATLPGTPA